MSDGSTPHKANAETDVVDETARPSRKRRTGLWLGIGVPGVLVVAGVVVSSLVLIAPGVAVAGTPVGFHTAGAAADAISQRLDQAEVQIGDITVTGEELGADIDAMAAAKSAYEEYPLWNVSGWNAGDAGAPDVTIDVDKATETLSERAPDLFVEPTDAQVKYADGAFTAVADKAGSGPDFDQIAADLGSALAADDDEIAVDATKVEVPATTQVDAAKKEAKKLNGLASDGGFYVGDELAVPVGTEQLGAWLTVEPDGEGSFTVTADAGKIQKTVDTLPGKVDREAQDATQIVNSSGEVLSGDDGQDGWKLTSTEGVADTVAKQLEELAAKEDGKGTLKVELQAETVEHTVTKLERTLEVDLGALQAYAKENGKVVRTFPVSPGKAGSETDQGNFAVYTKLDVQDMGNPDTSQSPYYYTPDVPYVMYFNGSEGFHGTYWHNEFGKQPMSHGCVNLSVSDAAWLFDWTPIGTEVSVHS